MNIFVLDKDPVKAAKYHCDKHVVKMILESGQMLCTAHWIHNLNQTDKQFSDFKRVKEAKEFILENIDSKYIPPWKMTHAKHPCSIWTAETQENYQWHLNLMKHLLKEYTKRYKKNHKAESVWVWLNENYPLASSWSSLKTEHPQCMPDECKVFGDPVAAYRKYYHEHKSYMAKWKWGPLPDWWKYKKI